MIMGLISWIVLGLVAGFLASMIVNKSGEGLVGDIVLGIIGALVGGFIARELGLGNGGLIWSILVATGGAVLVLVIYHAVVGKGRRTTV